MNSVVLELEYERELIYPQIRQRDTTALVKKKKKIKEKKSPDLIEKSSLNASPL